MISGDPELVEFLKTLGLGQYETLFANQAIDLEILPRLTMNELRELGLPMGDRLKLLSALERLEQTAANTGAKAQSRSAERRHVTVLFCDIVQSTEMATRLDPEDFSEVMRVYSSSTTKLIQSYKGFVAKYLGDGILAFFGYPSAHEDDAERAILAARKIQQMHQATPIRLESGVEERIRVRIGIHTGDAVVGSLEGATELGADVFGEVPNIAQRLMSSAVPGDVIISPQTRQLAGDRFEYAALEPRVLTGFKEPTKFFSVKREFRERTRFEIQNSGALTPFVGRSHFVDQLRAHWHDARSGSGRTVMVSGPAGMGKSRLANVLFDSVRADARTTLTFQFSPHHVGTALYPVSVQIMKAMGISRLSDAATQFRLLRRWMSDSQLDDPGSLALMASLLSLELDTQLAPLDMTPRQQMDETLHLLAQYFARLSSEGACVVLFEDVHWADPTTLRLIELIHVTCRNSALLLLVTCRSDLEGNTPRIAIDDHIHLKQLGNEDIATLAREVAKPNSLTDETIRTIVERAQGVPIFAEELTKSVIERLAAGAEDQSDLTQGHSLVPDSLVDSLSARLDALPEARVLAQVAAAIGREVPQDLLRIVSDYPAARFSAALWELYDAQLIVSLPDDESDALVFGHALIQEVAYSQMLRKDRRRIHARIVEVLETDEPPGQMPLPETLARHCEAAQHTEKAIRYLIAAGRNAMSKSANEEALQHLRRARHLAKTSDGLDAKIAVRLELEIESTIGIPLIAVEGYTSSETVRAFDRAEGLAREIADVQTRFQALFGLWGHRWMAGHIDMSQSIAAEMVGIAEQHQSVERQILANRCAGSTHWIKGASAAMLTHLDRVIALTKDMDTTELARKYAICPTVVAYVLSGYQQWLDGDREVGMARLQTGRARAYDMNHAYSKALVNSLLGGLGWLLEDAEMVQAHAQELRTIADERCFPFWQIYAHTLEGAFLGLSGDRDAGRRLIEQAIRDYDRMGVFIHRTVQLIMLGDIERRSNNARHANRLFDEAEALGNRTGETQWFGVLQRFRAELAA